VRFIRCLVLLAIAKNGIGLIKQLFLRILDLILVYVKLLGKSASVLSPLIAASATFVFFASSSSPVVVQITSGLSLMQLSQIRGPLLTDLGSTFDQVEF
jgi:hypothetical protein